MNDEVFKQDITDTLDVYACRSEANTFLSEKQVKAYGRDQVLYGSMHHPTGRAIIIDFKHNMTKNPVKYEHYLKQAYISLMNKEVKSKYMN